MTAALDPVPRQALASRRPLTVDEYEHALALGTTLRALRLHLGIRRPWLSQQAQVSVKHLYSLESGYRRTRRSTLQRIADALCIVADDADPDALGDELAAIAGIALAPETAYPERVNARRAARVERKVRTQQRGT